MVACFTPSTIDLLIIIIINHGVVRSVNMAEQLWICVCVLSALVLNTSYHSYFPFFLLSFSLDFSHTTCPNVDYFPLTVNDAEQHERTLRFLQNEAAVK